MTKVKNTIYVQYEEHETGGQIFQGDEDCLWPNYEDIYRHFKIIDVFQEENNCLTEYVDLSFKPKIKQALFILVVRYQTGSTFSTIYGAWHIEGVYKSEEEAEKIRDKIDNNTYEGYVPWKGYFESLEHIEIVEKRLR